MPLATVTRVTPVRNVTDLEYDVNQFSKQKN